MGFCDETKNRNFLDSEYVEDYVRQGFNEAPDRCDHIFEVARRVRDSAEMLNQKLGRQTIDVNEAYCAALLHDIGYIQELQDTGFHPIDGARFLEKHGFPRLAKLIICHSNSPEQARLKGLGEIPISDDIIAKLITYWDVQIKQGGQRVSYNQRLADVVQRYGKESMQYKAHEEARPRIEQILAEFDAYLR